MAWYAEPSSASGVTEYIESASKKFDQIAMALDSAKPNIEEFERSRKEIFDSKAGDELEKKVNLKPEAVGKFAQSARDVGAALRDFTPVFERYKTQHKQVCEQGASAADQLRRLRSQLSDEEGRLRSHNRNLEEGAEAATEVDFPGIANKRRRIRQLEQDLAGYKSRHSEIEKDFQQAVDRAIKRIAKADDVLYSNAVQRVYTQNVKNHVDRYVKVIKIVLIVATIVVAIVAFGPAGALVSMALLGKVLAIGVAVCSSIEVISTAVAGDEVTATMMIDLSIDIISAGLASAAYSGLKLSNKALKTGQAASKVSRVKHTAKGAKWVNRSKDVLRQSEKLRTGINVSMNVTAGTGKAILGRDNESNVAHGVAQAVTGILGGLISSGGGGNSSADAFIDMHQGVIGLSSTGVEEKMERENAPSPTRSPGRRRKTKNGDCDNE